jgi:exonuclease SbcC
MQGRADEFTKKTPAERKAILGEILGLESWNTYEDRAKRRLRAIEQEEGQIDTQVIDIDAELAREGQYKDDLIAAREALDRLSQEVNEAQERYYQLQEARNQLNSARKQQADLQNRLNQGQTELSHLQAEHDQKRQRLATLRELIETREDIDAGYAEWQAARRQERQLTESSREQVILLQRQTVVQGAITAARAELTSQRSVLTQRLADHERTVSEGNGAMVEEVQAQIETLELLEADMISSRDLIAGLREQQARLEAVGQGLKVEGETVVEQLRKIEEVRDPACPLCGQPLSDKHRAELVAGFKAERQQKETEWRQNNQELETAKAEAGVLVKAVSVREPELRKLTALRQRQAVLMRQADRAGESRAQIEAHRQELSKIDAALGNSDFAQAEHAELAEIEAGLTALGYDAALHQTVQDTVAHYEGYESRKAELDRALETIPQLEEALSGLDKRYAAWEDTLTGDRAALDTAQAQIVELEAQLVDFDQLERRLNDLRDEEGNARALVGAAEQKIKALGEQRRRRDDLLGRREQLSQEQGIYEELRMAFGKDGVPAMIIEAAIPEIERGANQILARMTDGRMNIRFDTQREKITGGIKETLDIKIADELGTRDYMTFSGGEAFRVNFAIRLALSQLLARRAGAQLRTLIIDEGFGTQDAQGRERLVGALNAIQDEFDLIMVITHIDELKDAFPARIEITKTPNGSMIELV